MEGNEVNTNKQSGFLGCRLTCVEGLEDNPLIDDL
jgi:hypothetical protein